MKLIVVALIIGLPVNVFAYVCKNESNSRAVIATAYTSSVQETDSTPNISAWGDRLEPGMRVIAVSRDLLAMGLTHGTLVSIEGFDKEFIVLDKMNKRWKNKIDIYMGNDREAALEWGKREVKICWWY